MNLDLYELTAMAISYVNIVFKIWAHVIAFIMNLDLYELTAMAISYVNIVFKIWSPIIPFIIHPA